MTPINPDIVDDAAQAVADFANGPALAAADQTAKLFEAAANVSLARLTARRALGSCPLTPSQKASPAILRVSPSPNLSPRLCRACLGPPAIHLAVRLQLHGAEAGKQNRLSRLI